MIVVIIKTNWGDTALVPMTGLAKGLLLHVLV
jgi:hypothetical protein